MIGMNIALYPGRVGLLRNTTRLWGRTHLFGLNSPRVRTAASTVTNKPPSESVGHAVTNVKEEASNTVADVAKTIAATSLPANLVGSKTSFAGITSAVAAQVPHQVLVLGLAGALPYLGTSLTSVYLAREAGLAAAGVAAGVDPAVAISVLSNCLDIQVTYGAVLLSFLGAIHWGFEFSGYGGHQGYRRLLLGISPVLVAWSTLALSPMTALAVQWIGFTGLWFFDMKATGAGWTPQWYSQYRFYLSVLVGTCIIGTLAGNSYFGPVAGHGQATHSLDLLRAERLKTHPEGQGLIKGNVEAVSTGEMGDSYVKIQKKQESAEDGEEESKTGDGKEGENTVPKEKK